MSAAIQRLATPVVTPVLTLASSMCASALEMIPQDNIARMRAVVSPTPTVTEEAAPAHVPAPLDAAQVAAQLASLATAVAQIQVTLQELSTPVGPLANAAVAGAPEGQAATQAQLTALSHTFSNAIEELRTYLTAQIQGAVEAVLAGVNTTATDNTAALTTHINNSVGASRDTLLARLGEVQGAVANNNTLTTEARDTVVARVEDVGMRVDNANTTLGAVHTLTTNTNNAANETQAAVNAVSGVAEDVRGRVEALQTSLAHTPTHVDETLAATQDVRGRMEALQTSLADTPARVNETLAATQGVRDAVADTTTTLTNVINGRATQGVREAVEQSTARVNEVGTTATNTHTLLNNLNGRVTEMNEATNNRFTNLDNAVGPIDHRLGDVETFMQGADEHIGHNTVALENVVHWLQILQGAAAQTSANPQGQE